MSLKFVRLIPLIGVSLFCATSCSSEGEDTSSSLSTSTSIPQTSVPSSTIPETPKVSREVWESQINNLDCLDGDYTITAHNHITGGDYDDDLLEVFEHTEGKWHLTQTYESSGKLYFEEFVIRQPNGYKDYYRTSFTDNFILYNSYTYDPYYIDDTVKENFWWAASIFVQLFEYDEIIYSNNEYSLNRTIIQQVLISDYLNKYKITDLKLTFNEDNHLSTFSNKVLIEGYDNGTLDSSYFWTISGAFTSFDPVTIEAPENYHT